MKRDIEVQPSRLYRSMGEILWRVLLARESFVVTKRGERLARLTSAEEVPADKKGVRRFSRGEYVEVPRRRFRSKMADCLAQVRFGGQRLLITYRGHVVAILMPAN
jgi:antitoxin (DNA-binding transcriptional repressor) of toxin-antitoxin stability system